jgi:exonuclease VII small subunit
MEAKKPVKHHAPPTRKEKSLRSLARRLLAEIDVRDVKLDEANKVLGEAYKAIDILERDLEQHRSALQVLNKALDFGRQRLAEADAVTVDLADRVCKLEFAAARRLRRLAKVIAVWARCVD